ncbi:MAG: alkaline phosphatase family protein [Deltaproteobacteria bacterium]|nr:alkaline phosphatase family protein [Deltaproteobacteria bacterium]MBW2417452.1 alkaline phosphatase family protein [Deltaproteobacteria bacterium]
MYSNRITRPLVAFLSLTLAAGFSGCSEPYERPGRVLLIGVDGASPKVVAELILQGRLPNLARLKEEGAAGDLKSSQPIESPRIWNTIVTGQMPSKHGIASFSKKDAQGVHHLFLSTDRTARTIWSIASAKGMTVGVVNFWNTYPLERVNGVMVSDHVLAKEIDGRERMTGAATTPTGAVIYPPSWNDRLAKLMRANATPLPDHPNPFAEDKVLPRWVLRDELSRRFAEDGALTRLALEIERGTQPDLLMVLLPGIDRISHYIWGVLEPEEMYPPGLRPTPEGRAGGRDALFAYYEYVDALIGELIADYGPDDLVMVVSDHGFEAGQALMRLSGVHDSKDAIHGIVFARGPGVPAGSRPHKMTVRDVVPTLLLWMGLPIARDMDGGPASFLESPPKTPIDSYDDVEISFVEDTESGVEQDIVEHLRTLGYIEDEE